MTLIRDQQESPRTAGYQGNLVGRRSASPLPREATHAAGVIRKHWDRQPSASLILGTGLGDLARHIDADLAIDYRDIPGFPCSTALSHKGQLVCGRLSGTPVIAMDGRCHRYEGYSLAKLILPVLTMRALGSDLLIASNASGGLNWRYHSGDVMVIEDHVNLMFTNPDVAQLLPRQETRGPASLRCYDPVLVEQALWIARQEGFIAHSGVYVAMTGPNYETRAEYRFLRSIGGDVVGMSTIPEVLAAASCGMRTLALSSVTNVARPDSPQIVKADDVVAAAENAAPAIRTIVARVLADPWPADTCDRHTGQSSVKPR